MAKRWISLAEALGVYGLIIACIWLGQQSRFRPPLLVGGFILFGVCYASNKFHGDDLEKIGLSRKWFRRCAESTILIAGLPLVFLFLWAFTKPLPPIPKIIFGVLGYPLWAFAQEYALLSFLGNRLRDGLGPRPVLVALINGALFSLVHAPNPILMTVCFFGGAGGTWIFQKTPHILPPALAHAAAGFLLSVVFQNYYPAMMVGPAYMKWSAGYGHKIFSIS